MDFISESKAEVSDIVVTTRAENVIYGRPSMTNLPYDLGISIYNTIINSPAPDFTKADQEVMRLKEKVREEWQREAGKKRASYVYEER